MNSESAIFQEFTGFPALIVENLISKNYNSTFNSDVVLTLCDDLETATAAVELTNTILSHHIGNSETVESDFSLAMYNLYVAIFAAIVTTLAECNDVSAFSQLRSIPKFVTDNQFITYIHNTFGTLFNMIAINIQFDNGMMKGVDKAIVNAVESYHRYTSNPKSTETTIYTILEERKYPQNRNINGIRIHPFPSIDEYIKFVNSKYDVDILNIPKKYRDIIFARDEEINEIKRNIVNTESQDKREYIDSIYDKYDANNHEDPDITEEGEEDDIETSNDPENTEDSVIPEDNELI